MIPVKVDKTDPTDLYEQVAGEIRRAIAEGEAAPGERLPPARDLAAVLGVNANTVLRALRLLRDEGLLEFRRGRGITVAGSPGHGAVVAAGPRPGGVRAPPRLPGGRASSRSSRTSPDPRQQGACRQANQIEGAFSWRLSWRSARQRVAAAAARTLGRHHDLELRRVGWGGNRRCSALSGTPGASRSPTADSDRSQPDRSTGHRPGCGS